MNLLRVFPDEPSGSGLAFDVEAFSFPGGERHVRLPASMLEIADRFAAWGIEARLYDAAGVMDLLLATDALRRAIPVGATVRLVMPYVPYARQDRVAVPGEALSAKVFAALINSQGFASVEAWDPHSDVIPALIDNLRVTPTSSLLKAAVAGKGQAQLLRECAFVAPDAGARKRVGELARAYGTEVVYADKVRDLVSGKLSGTRVPDALPERPLLVIDDLCDAGGTFLLLADALRAKTSQPLYLYVTHGLFTRGLDALKTKYDRVFAAHCRDTALETQLG
ncbi:ribose-phosphate diphosphokinase [Thiobacillus denitrificans]|uniref:ribose-phosphate diphosphokinase n=1 Tax=Thiobacillus denitrificans TaxID=36861 RepID=UPI00036DA72E|nr:ribose-phosphate diphosphokinase [Thiobacillus denitrificans]